MDQHRIDNGYISATIKAAGAELCSLADAAGREMLWQAGPAWPRHAPVLFPIVGRLANDTLHDGGRDYRLTQHGFARDSLFAWEIHAAEHCRLTLNDSEATRASYPYPFRLTLDYVLRAATLDMVFAVSNPGPDTLPASFGAHPAFRWPLAEGVAKEAHTLVFAQAEPAPIRRLHDGLLRPDGFPTPILGDCLKLTESLFADDAIILDRPASRFVRFAAPGIPGLTVAWDGFAQLSVWMRLGGGFLCIEPWQGFASPIGFDGEFRDKPGLLLIPPGEERTATMSVTLE